MNFDFLKNTSLTAVEKPAKEVVSRPGKTPIERNPTNGASLRVFKDGSVYPSQETVNNYTIEYGDNEYGNTPNGFDVIDSRKWSQYPQDAQPVVFITAVPKKSGMVDLFSLAKADNVSVMTQGSKTFGPELITMLQEVYNVEDLFATQKYVDLIIVEDVVLPSLDGIYNVPKTVVKGVNKGQITTKRRENIVVNPLALFVAENNTAITAEVEENVEEMFELTA